MFLFLFGLFAQGLVSFVPENQMVQSKNQFLSVITYYIVDSSLVKCLGIIMSGDTIFGHLWTLPLITP